ncbi:MAG: hypothetical protein PVH68_17505 [Armatimonadota bacterium]|jgi:hypothetical protein
MRHRLIVLAIVLLGGVLLAAAGSLVAAQGGAKGKPAVAESPIVAAVAIQSETRYATDAFGQGELRDSLTQVTKVLIVRANGEMERKPVR